jgi:DNA repair exonuclease SbcCD ATPase subunit
MEIIIDYIKFRNLLSFGSKWTEIKFQPGMSIVSGDNGSGKSTSVLEALSYNWFGKPYRDILLADLINWTNGRELETESKFSINNDIYIVNRGMKPNKFNIIKNNNSLDMLSTKDLNQDELEKILGINYKMFKQVISLAICYNKPFLTMKLEDKREILENVFNVRVFGKMLYTLKKQVSLNKVDYEVNKKTVAVLEENLSIMRKNLKEVKDAKDKFDTNKITQSNTIKLEIDSSKNIISTIDQEILKENEKIVELNKNIIILENEKIVESSKQNKYITESDCLLTGNHELIELYGKQVELNNKIKELKEKSDTKIESKEIDELNIKIGELHANIELIMFEKFENEEEYIKLTTEVKNIENIKINEIENIIILKNKLNIKAEEQNKLKIELDYLLNEDKTEINNKINKLNNDIKSTELLVSNNNFQIDQKENKIKHFQTNNICDSCGQSITEEYKKEKNKVIYNEINLINIDNNTLNENIKLYNQELNLCNNEVNKKIEKQKQLEKDSASLISEYILLKSEYNNLIIIEETNKTNKIKEINNKIASSRNLWNQLNKEKINEINNDIEKYNNQITNILKELKKETENNILNINNEIILINLRIESKVNEINNEINKNKKIYDDKIKEINDKIKDIENDMSTSSKSIVSLKSRIDIYKKSINEAENRLTSINDSKFDIDVDKQTEEFNNKISQYQTSYKNLNELSEKIRINDIVSNILGDKGIKSYFFSKLIPILNLKINDYISKFNIPIKISFDELMNESIMMFGSTEPKNYLSFSEGQKKIIDISILLSFISITKLICNWDCSILLIDELLDGQVDDKNLDKILQSIKDMLANNSIYIISHRLNGEWLGQFDNIINVSNKSGFSEITYG